MDSKQFVKTGNYINVKAVEALPADKRTFVILGEGETKSFKDTQKGTTQEKLQIPISYTETKETYEWTLGYQAINDLAKELGSYDTKHWVGAIIKLLLMPTKQGSNTVTATVLQKPTRA